MLGACGNLHHTGETRRQIALTFPVRTPRDHVAVGAQSQAMPTAGGNSYQVAQARRREDLDEGLVAKAAHGREGERLREDAEVIPIYSLDTAACAVTRGVATPMNMTRPRSEPLDACWQRSIPNNLKDVLAGWMQTEDTTLLQVVQVDGKVVKNAQPAPPVPQPSRQKPPPPSPARSRSNSKSPRRTRP